jgi:uncharacterized caspase-like protein
MPNEDGQPGSPSSKDVRPRSPLALDSGPVNRWALVVGVSRYQHDSLNLKFAAKDAEELTKILRSGQCGTFTDIRTLIDAEATTAGVTRALRSFFAQAAANDLVLLYFSCHGGPDPKRPKSEVMYLLTHDADPNDIAGTALRMDEINRSLQDYVEAQRRLIFLDTCHSGFAGAVGAKAGEGHAGPMIDFLQRNLSAEGIGWLTSAEGGEVSFEDQRWGGGHGVFTHYLLEGLRGAADGFPDKPKDGVVSIDELFEFVRAKVREDAAVRQAQNPFISISGSIRRLPLAYTGDFDARKLADLGADLYRLGRREGERVHYLAAADRFMEAARVAQGRHPAAEAGLGRALLAAGKAEDAAAVLRGLVDRDAAGAPAEVWLDLGLALAESGRFDPAAQALDRFVSAVPDDPAAAFAKAAGDSLARRESGRKRALLIGIDVFRDPTLPRFRGCVNDVTLMHDVLVDTLGFDPADIAMLTNEKATRAALRAALRRLARDCEVGDLVLVHYSGLALPDDHPLIASGASDAFLFAHDSRPSESGVQNAVGFDELHGALMKLRALNKALVLDAPVQTRFIRLAEEKADYNLWTAERPNRLSIEGSFVLRGESVQAGLFSGCLVEALRAAADPEALANGDLLRAVRAAIAGRRAAIAGRHADQEPQLIGDPGLPFLARSRLHMAMWAFAGRQSYRDLGASDIGRLYNRYSGLVKGPFPAWHASIGRGFAAHRVFEPAVRALKKALVESGGEPADLLLDLGRAQLGARDYQGAIASFRRHSQAAGRAGAGDIEARTQAWVALIERLARSGRHALLVGVEKQAASALPYAVGAEQDVLALRAAIETRYDFAPGDITVLVNEQATRQAIGDAVRALVERAREGAALLFFAGNGSTEMDRPTLLPYDARIAGTRDITFDDLRGWIGPHAGNLVTILDAGWAQPPESDKGFRYAMPEAGPAMATREIRKRPARPAAETTGTGGPSFAASAHPAEAVARPVDAAGCRLGEVTILGGSIRYVASGSLPPLRSPDIHDGQPGGVLTGRLVQILKATDAANLTWRRWTDPLAAQADLIPPLVIASDLDAPAFVPGDLMIALETEIADYQRTPYLALADALTQLIRTEALPPRYEVNLGILNLAIGRAGDGMDRLSHAVQPSGEPTPAAAAPAGPFDADLAAEYDWAAHYHLGRAYVERGVEPGIAVKMLRYARDRRWDEPRTAYYLGRAILQMLDHRQVSEAEEELQRYLDRGAPLGDRDTVTTMLGQLRTIAQSLTLPAPGASAGLYGGTGAG